MRVKDGIRRYPRTVLTLIAVAALAILALGTFQPPGQLLFQRTTDSGLEVLVQRQAHSADEDKDLGSRCPGRTHIVVRINDSNGGGASLGETEVGEWPTESSQDPNRFLTVAGLSYGSSPRGEIVAAYAIVLTSPRVNAVRGRFMEKSDQMRPVRGLAVLAVRTSPPLDPRRRMVVEAFDDSGQVIAEVDDVATRQIACLLG